MKIFISHKQEDSEVAKQLNNAFKTYEVDTYLDLIDENISKDGKELTKHIKQSLNSCTDIIVVISEKTRLSQWVPFEVGMSSQKDMPTVTFMIDDVDLPEFLDYWPRLRHFSDVKKYIEAKRIVSLNESHDRGSDIFNYNRMSSTNDFYNVLKKIL